MRHEEGQVWVGREAASKRLRRFVGKRVMEWLRGEPASYVVTFSTEGKGLVFCEVLLSDAKGMSRPGWRAARVGSDFHQALVQALKYLQPVFPKLPPTPTVALKPA